MDRNCPVGDSSPEALDKRVRITSSMAVFISQLVCLLVITCGCQSLRARRHTRELSVARQNSLRGQEKLQQNKFEEAEFLFTEALRRSSADERAQAGMAEVLWQRGAQEQALAHMTQAATLSGGNPDTFVRLGEMYLQQGLLDRALAQADLAVDHQRNHAGGWALRGKVLQQRQQFEESMACYHRALSSQPNLPEVQISLAEIYRGLGRPQRALATLDAMTDEQASGQANPRAWMLKGMALADMGEINLAQTCLKNAALCCSDVSSDVLLKVAQTQIETGDFAEARICLGRALQYDPHNPLALQLQVALQQKSPQVGGGRLAGFEQPSATSPQN